MLHQLPALGARGREAHAADDVVEAALEQAEHVLARRALHARRVREVARELTLEHSVDASDLLLLTQTEAVLGELDAGLAVLPRRVRATRDAALLGVAALALEIELDAFAATQLADGTDVTSHF